MNELSHRILSLSGKQFFAGNRAGEEFVVLASGIFTSISHIFSLRYRFSGKHLLNKKLIDGTASFLATRGTSSGKDRKF